MFRNSICHEGVLQLSAKACTVISFLSKIDTSLTPPFFCPAPDSAVFFAFALFFLFAFIIFAYFLYFAISAMFIRNRISGCTAKIWDHCGTILCLAVGSSRPRESAVKCILNLNNFLFKMKINFNETS